MGFKDFFTNRTETSDRHHINDLKTRYYKTNKQKALNAVRDLIRADPKMELLDYSEERGEMTAQILKPRRAFMVVSVITVYPYRTAIDFTITTQTLFIPIDFGYSKKTILHTYQKLDQQLEFVGVGLGEGIS